MADDDLHINAKITIPAAELNYATSRSSGPGGQHANKTSSRVTLSWNIQASAALEDRDKERLAKRLATRITDAGELQVSVDESRSQFRNRALARQRLAELVREALVRRKARIATKPSKASKKRRLETKKKRSDTKKLRQKPPRDDE